jgi:hypothetical protein
MAATTVDGNKVDEVVKGNLDEVVGKTRASSGWTRCELRFSSYKSGSARAGSLELRSDKMGSARAGEKLGLARASSLWYINSINSNLCKEIEHVNIQIFS